jgi:hypothetical protein
MKQCWDNLDCVGIEWNDRVIRYNPQIGEHEEYVNICCEKSTLGDYIARNDMNKMGKFYQKYNV